MQTNTLEGLKPPAPPKLKRGRGAWKGEQKKIGLEMAAAAYVQMEHGVYRYPPNSRRGNKDEDGKFGINKSEVLRRAGYSEKTAPEWERYIGDNQDFWDLVELYRLRFSDPNFDKGKEHLLWAEIGNEALKNLYERVTYYPHTMPTGDLIKIANLAIDAGLVPVTSKDDIQSRAQGLMESLSEDDRTKALEGYRKKLERDMKNLDALEGVYRASDL